MKNRALVEKLQALPVDFWDFNGTDTREYTHGIHSYPAVMVSPISRAIIAMVKEVGYEINSVLDPYMGSGTVLVEAHLSNIEYIYGNDLNPLARFIGKNKLLKISSQDFNGLFMRISSLLDEKWAEYKILLEDINSELGVDYDLADKDGWGSQAPSILKEYLEGKAVELCVPDFKNIGYWFKPSVIVAIQLIKEVINTLDNVEQREYATLALSESIRLVSNRRNGEFKLYRMTADKVRAFAPDVKTIFLDILYENINKLSALGKYNEDNNIVTHVHILAEDTNRVYSGGLQFINTKVRPLDIILLDA